MKQKKERPKSLKSRLEHRGRFNPLNLATIFEWCCEWISFWLSKWAFLEVLEYVGKLSILVAAIAYIWPGCKERKQAANDAVRTRDYVAWQTLNSAMGKPGNAGRVNALQDLVQDRVNLNGISLTGGAVIGGPLNLTNQELESSDFSAATVANVDFSGSIFIHAQFAWARFINCDFKGAFFSCVFTNTFFDHCNFAGANFDKSIVSDRTQFSDCNFAHANFLDVYTNSLRYVALGGSEFYQCNFYCASNIYPEMIGEIRQDAWKEFTDVTSIADWVAFIDERNLAETKSLALFKHGDATDYYSIELQNMIKAHSIYWSNSAASYHEWESNQWIIYSNEYPWLIGTNEQFDQHEDE